MNPKLLLEYQQRTHPAWVGWALLGIVLLLAFDVSVRKGEAEAQLAVWQSPGRTSGVIATTEADASPVEAELREAVSVVDQLALPWSPLFSAIERAHIETVALLAVQPDAQRRSVTIIGEAKGYDDVLGYVARLRSEARLTQVFLVSNESREDQPHRPVAFTVSASWGALR